jgi:hypothetical protein
MTGQLEGNIGKNVGGRSRQLKRDVEAIQWASFNSFSISVKNIQRNE